ncbi:MAG: type II secretion system F family protein [Candidatus Omnitrophica bacterium]|nr:type II secretion system F family protein [Candidatus Omnitrophota bacterium]MDD5488531.1 type II secretion system F family protein [Candidatus Omnitrophota bacterium]
MPYYSYKIRDKKGRIIKNHMFTSSEQDLVKVLQREGALVLGIKEMEAIETKTRRKMHKKVTIEDLVLFAKELAILLENGIPLIETFEVAIKQIESQQLLVAAEQVKVDLERGTSFRESIARHPTIFNDLWCDLVEAGELSGQLPFVLRQILEFLESRANLHKQISNAFLYPILLLGLAIATVLVFILKVVPIFEELFSSFDAKLPPFTQVIVDISNIVKDYFLMVATGLGLLVFFFIKAISTKYGRRVYEGVLFKIPILGRFLLALAIQTFTTTLSVLIKSGIPIMKGLEVASKTPQSLLFDEQIEQAKVRVMGGEPLSEALNQTGLFPPLAVQFVYVAEKTGNYGKMLEEVSKYYADIVENLVVRFTTLLGPLVLIFMTVIIGSLIVAMFLPIFKLASIA